MTGTLPMDELKLDFSQFHPFDHWPWQRRCRQLYGGPRHHLSLVWTLRYRETLFAVAQRVRCLVGHHDLQPFWRGPLPISKLRSGSIEPSGFFCSGYRCRFEP